jgi:dienelactone hydrolase
MKPQIIDKIRTTPAIRVLAIVLWCTTIQSRAQAPLAHSFAHIAVLPDGAASLTLTGHVSAILWQYFDIYPLEASSDLVNWKPLATLVRSNASRDALVYSDIKAVNLTDRFYRTFTNQFVTALTKPTGPYPVGRVNRLVTDPSRTNRYFLRNSSFMVTITYPAESTAGIRPDRYVEPALADAVFGEPDTVRQLFAFSILNAPIRTNEPSYPVVLYSHGYGSNRRQNTEKAEELASHGYIVAAMDHIDCSGTIFPDGRLLYGSQFDPSLPEPQAARELVDRVKDVRFVLDELTWLSHTDSVFAGRLDLEHVGGMGHSFGVGTLAEAARVDERIKAGVFLDGYLQGAAVLRTNGLQKPLLEMHNANTGSMKILFSLALTNAYWCQITNAVHNTFIDLWRSELANASSRQASEAMRACMLSFFDKHLKQEDDHLLDNPTNSFPVIFNYVKK